MTEAVSRHAPQGHPFVPDDDTPVLADWVLGEMAHGAVA